MTQFLKRAGLPDLAYVKVGGHSTMPAVMFLGGFRSDMEGTKAIYLQQECEKRGQTYVRFDYRGHGKSEGKFEEACISEWVKDAKDVLDHCLQGAVILVGSSMGGWVSLLLAHQGQQNIQAIVGLAAAPDFTQWMEDRMNDDQKNNLSTKGFFELPNDYDDSPYIISKKLIDDGRENFLLDKKINVQIPVRLIQGKQDADVPWKTAERIREAIPGDDVNIIYIEDADHRLSMPDQLEVLGQTVESLL